MGNTITKCCEKLFSKPQNSFEKLSSLRKIEISEISKNNTIEKRIPLIEIK